MEINSIQDHKINNNKYTKYLFDKLKYKNKNHNDIIREAFLRRGFMCKENGELHKGSTESDIVVFNQLINKSNRLVIKEKYYIHEFDSEIYSDDKEYQDFRYCISAFSKPFHGEIGHYGCKTDRFFRTKYGNSRPSADILDPSAALFVKTLPLAGIWTWCSCDGHHFLTEKPSQIITSPPKPAHIEFAEKWDSLWLEAIINIIKPRFDLKCHWNFGQSHFEIKAPDDIKDPYERAFLQDEDMQTIARWLMICEVNESIRAARKLCHRAKIKEQDDRFNDSVLDLNKRFG